MVTRISISHDKYHFGLQQKLNRNSQNTFRDEAPGHAVTIFLLYVYFTQFVQITHKIVSKKIYLDEENRI
jgi:hypothetical protein